MIINIKYSKLLDPFIKPSVLERYPDYEFPTIEAVKEKVKLFRKVYEEKGVDLIKEMEKFTGYSFKDYPIDCHIVSAISRDMSSPLIIRSRYNEDEFLESLLHELVHILYGQNKVPFITGYDDTVSNHIPVYRILRHLGYDNEPVSEDYRKAWELSKIPY